MNGVGRPKFASDYYLEWLKNLEPFLKQGRSLRNAIDCAGLTGHKNVLYQHYKDNPEFRDKIDYFSGYMGELINEAIARQIKVIYDKVVSEKPLAKVEVRILIYCAKHYRPCNPFFILGSKSETKRNKYKKRILKKFSVYLANF